MPEIKDPVCGMTVDPDTAKWKSNFEGQTWHFCSEACKQEFDRNPERYVERAAAATDSRGGATTPERHEPRWTTKGGITAPKFGSAGSGGAEYELTPEAHGTKKKK